MLTQAQHGGNIICAETLVKQENKQLPSEIQKGINARNKTEHQQSSNNLILSHFCSSTNYTDPMQ